MTGLTNPKFDYDSIDKQEAAKLRYYEGELTKSRKRVSDEIIKHGEILCGARAVLANHTDGVFCKWLDSRGISRTSAYRAMDAYTGFGGFPNWENIEVSAMYELAKNEDAKKRAMKLADKGTIVTHDIAKKLLEEVAKKDEPKPPKREQPATAPAIEPHVAALDGETIDIDPQPPTDKCPCCAAVSWTPDGDKWACGRCHHPYGEPAGEPDTQRINEARSLAIKYAEAMMRAIDGLQHLIPNTQTHAAAHGHYTEIWLLLKAWK